MLKLPLAAAVLACAFASIGEAAEGVDVRYSEPLVDFTLSAAGSGASAKPTAGGPVEIKFIALGHAFELALEPNARLEPLEQQLNASPAIAAYRGTVVGAAGSWVRLVVSPDGPAGLIFDGKTLYAVETAVDTAVQVGHGSPQAPAIFRLSDVYLAPGMLGCSAVDPAATASQALQAMVGEFTALAVQGARLNLNIGAVADADFEQSFADPTAALLTRFNNVDGIFSEQVGVQITVAEIAVFTPSDDPFTTTNPSDLLDELAAYRGATPAQDTQGLTHMFTGRNLDGTTAGIAFVGSLCSHKSRWDPLGRSFGAGLSEGRRGAATDSLIAAHEIGHNFGAPHDGEAGSACESTPTTFLMAPSINGSDQFSQCSLDQMQTEISSATCLQPIGAPDVALSANTPNTNVLAGVGFDYTLSVTNLGVDTATGVGLEVSSDAQLELQSVTTSSGSCTTANQTVSCTLGDIVGGSSRQVTITMRSGAVGTLTVSGAATADSDTNPANNSLADTITVVPTVDLVVGGANAALEVDQQRVVSATLENAGDFGANHVTLQATLSAGLRPDSATLGGNACTIDAQTVTCPTAALAAHATIDLALTITALASGTQNVALAAAADEADLNANDNDLSLAVDVSAPAPSAGSSQGGGGGDSGLSVLLLGCAVLARRWRRASARAQCKR